jgi:hypothetical protein
MMAALYPLPGPLAPAQVSAPHRSDRPRRIIRTPGPLAPAQVSAPAGERAWTGGEKDLAAAAQDG